MQCPEPTALVDLLLILLKILAIWTGFAFLLVAAIITIRQKAIKEIIIRKIDREHETL